jgi:hypothetical protein
MGCSSCGGGASFHYQPVYQMPETIENCSYTTTILSIWKTQLDCVKSHQYYGALNTTEQVVNSYLGYVLTGLASPNQICKFKIQYDEISNFIVKIINKQLC